MMATEIGSGAAFYSFVAPSQNQELEMKCMGRVLEPQTLVKGGGLNLIHGNPFLSTMKLELWEPQGGIPHLPSERRTLFPPVAPLCSLHREEGILQGTPAESGHMLRESSFVTAGRVLQRTEAKGHASKAVVEDRVSKDAP